MIINKFELKKRKKRLNIFAGLLIKKQILYSQTEANKVKRGYMGRGDKTGCLF